MVVVRLPVAVYFKMNVAGFDGGDENGQARWDFLHLRRETPIRDHGSEVLYHWKRDSGSTF